MAGDWLKFEKATPDKPEVWAIASALDIDPDAVVGKLLRIWGWFDEQTEKGNAPSVTKMLLDRLVGVTGFCDQVIDAGWMIDDGKTITLPNFDRHNGKTSKNRALAAKRQSNFKAKSNAKGNGKVTQPVTQSALPREEKRREDSNTLSLSNNKNIPSETAAVLLTIAESGWCMGERQLNDLVYWRKDLESRADEVEQNFRDHYRSTGERSKDWDAQWRKWIRREKSGLGPCDEI